MNIRGSGKGREYFFTTFDSDDRLQIVVPNAIQIGDIVEVQMSILLAPTNNHRFKTILKLRAIVILETKYTDVSTLKRPN